MINKLVYFKKLINNIVYKLKCLKLIKQIIFKIIINNNKYSKIIL